MHGFHHLLDDPFTRFIVQAVVIIGVARLIGLLMRRLDQPMVVAEVIAGIVLGPSLLGWLAPGVSRELFAPQSLPVLNIVSQIGLTMFMFLIGLELDPKLLRGRGHSSVVISHTSIIVPFALGALVALHLYPRLAPAGVPFSSFTLFMGVAMSITAFPVLARILAERRMLQSKVGAATIACAAIDDVTAWCLLAFVVSTVRSHGLLPAIRTTALVLVYVGTMLFAVRPLLARIAARSANREGLSQNVVAATLMLLLSSSWVTEQIGIHALFGAFMFGVIMPRQGGFVSVLAEKLEDIVLVFLLPLFFAYSGLRTHVGLLNSPDVWIMCGMVILAASLGKLGENTVTARITGLSWREASAIGVLMNTRGLMELVVLNIGLDLGVISPTLFTMMVIMALVTTFMTSPILRWLYPPGALTGEPVDATPLPVPTASFTILMCVSYDRSGPGLVTLASALSGKGRLFALRLIPPTDRASFYVRTGSEEPSSSALEPLLERADEIGAAVKPLSFVSPHPAQDICSVADVKGADLVLLGWHKPLLRHAVLGGTVSDVMRLAGTDVGVLIDRGLTSIRRVLVPFQGSVHDKLACALARRLQASGAEVTILHVVAPQRSGDAKPLGARAEADRAFSEEAGPPVIFKLVEHDSPAEAAAQEAALGYDLIVVGAGQEWGLEQRVFGLYPERLIQRCPTSLLVVRNHVAALAHARSAPGHAVLQSARPVTSDGTS